MSDYSYGADPKGGVSLPNSSSAYSLAAVEINLILNATQAVDDNILMDVDIKYPGYTGLFPRRRMLFMRSSNELNR